MTDRDEVQRLVAVITMDRNNLAEGPQQPRRAGDSVL